MNIYIYICTYINSAIQWKMIYDTDTDNDNVFPHDANNSNERQPHQIMQKQPIITKNDGHYYEIKRKPAKIRNSITMVHVIKTMEHMFALPKNNCSSLEPAHFH